MSDRKASPNIVLLFVSMGLLLGGLSWWFTRSGDLRLGSLFGQEQANAESDNLPEARQPQESKSEFSDIQNVPSGAFSYGGSTTWAPVRLEVDAVMQTSRPDFRLQYIEPTDAPPGSGTGIKMLLRNELAFSQSSRPLKDKEQQQAQENGYLLKQIPVASEGVAIAVNPRLPIDSLTLEQVKAIYTGELTNWQQLGGPDVEIIPLSRPAVGGTVAFFLKTVMDSKELSTAVKVVDNTTEGLAIVGESLGAIYYASAPELVPQCTVKPVGLSRDETEETVRPYSGQYVLPEECPNKRNEINREAFGSGDYPLTRQLFVIVREDGGIDQKAGEAYVELLLTQEGKNLLNTAGFVPLP